MKKTITIALILGAFLLGKYWGETSVILNQNIWTDGEYHFAEYQGKVHYYAD